MAVMVLCKAECFRGIFLHIPHHLLESRRCCLCAHFHNRRPGPERLFSSLPRVVCLGAADLTVFSLNQFLLCQKFTCSPSPVLPLLAKRNAADLEMCGDLRL